MAGSEFLVRVRARFEAAGMQQIVAEARQALLQLGNVRVGQQGSTARGIRTEAESRIAQLRHSELSRAGGDTVKQAEIRARYNTIARNLSHTFDQLSKSTGDFAKLSGDVRRNVQAAIRNAIRGQTAPDTATLRRGVQAAAAGTARSYGAGGSARAEGRDRAPDILDRARVAAQAQKTLAADDAYARQQIIATAAKAATTRKTQEGLAADDAYITDTARAANARRSQATRIRASELGNPLRDEGGKRIGDQQLEVNNAVRERINADRQSAAVMRARAQRDTVLGQELAGAEAERRAATRELARVEHAEAKREVDRAIQGKQGTRYQRLQAAAAYKGQQKLPEEYQTLGQFVGARALTTFGFAAAGTALYGTVRIIGEMIKEAEQLELVLNQIDAQLTAIGGNSEEQFQTARKGILDIAARTGAQADETGKVFFQFRGAFGGSGDAINDTAEALKQTEQAMKVVAVTGLSLNEVIDSLTAVAKTFNTDIDTISDSALGLQERFGVMAKETITFTADLAPVAKDIGLSLKDTAALGAVAQQVSGRSGAVLAEGFARILPAISEAKGEILSLYNLPELKGGRPTILKGFATGQTGDVFQQIVRDYDKLSATNQKFVISTLGSRREAQFLIPVLAQSSKLIAEWDRNASGLSDSNKTEDYFNRLRETITNTNKRFAEMGKQIGEALFSSGLADSFADIVNLAGGLVGALASVARVVGDLNSAAGGLPIQFLAFAGVLRILSPLIDRVAVRMRIQTGASKASAAANAGQGNSYVGLSAKASLATGAVDRATAADVRETLSSRAAAVANAAQGAAQGSVFARARAGIYGAPPVAAGPGLFSRAAYGFIGAPNTLNRFGGALVNRGAAVGVQGTRALVGGGSVLGRGIPAASGMAAALRSSVLIFAAFEALNQFMQNSAEQAEKANKVADDARKRLDEARQREIEGVQGETVAEAQNRVEQDARGARVKAQSSIGFLGGDNPLSTGVNFLGGKAANLLGGFTGNKGAGDAALRAAAGEKQDYEKIEDRIAADRAKQYAKIIGPVLNNYDADFLRILGSGDRKGKEAVLNSALSQNKGFKSEAVDKVAGKDGKIQLEELTKDNIRALIEAAEKGDQKAAELLRLLSDYINTNPELKAVFDKSDLKTRADAAGGLGELTLQSLADNKKQFEAGALTSGARLQKLTQARDNLIEQIATARREKGGSVDPNDILVLAETNKDIAGLVQGRFEAQAEALAKFREIQGVGSPASQALAGGTRIVNGQNVKGDVQGVHLDQQIAQLTAQIDEGTGLSTADQLAKVEPLLQLLQERFTRKLENIRDPIERAAAAERGFEIPDDLQRLHVEGQLTKDNAFNQYVQDLATATDKPAQEYFNTLANGVLTTANDARTILLAIMDAEISKLQNIIATTMGPGADIEAGNRASKALVALQASRQSLSFNGPAGADTSELPGTGFESEQAQSQRLQTERADAEKKARALNRLANARAGGDSARVARNNLNLARDALKRAGDDPNDQLEAEADLIEAQEAYDESQERIGTARLQLLQQRNSRDPVRSAGIGVQLARRAMALAEGEEAQIQAQIGLLQAEDAYRQAQDAREDAQYDLMSAQVSRDPIRSAQVSIARAQAQANRAQSFEERISAQTAQIAAQDSLAEAMESLAQAQAEQVEAFLDAAGFTVEAAQARLGEAQRRLQAVLADPGSGQEAATRAQTDVIRAQAGARDANFQDQLGDIEFLQQMEQIGVSQSIQMLQSMLQIPELTEEQIRNLQLKIKQLQQETKTDFQFNIPSEIALPTLYEVRRLNQTPSGQGYNDNRNISIQFSATNQVDAQAVANTIVDGFSRPSRFGNAPKKY